MNEPGSILVVRRDNIGDLVCTTPLLSAVRRRYPKAWIGVLANSYNAPVLEGNPDIDAVFAYRKLTHADAEHGVFAALTGQVALLWSLRRRQLDLAVLAAPAFSAHALRLARLLKPRSIGGFSDGSSAALRLNLAVPLAATCDMHEVEAVFRLAPLLDLHGEIPRLSVVATPAATLRASEALAGAGLQGRHPLVGVHISARRAAQRWPAERFVDLIVALHARHAAAILLFWSPGAASQVQHPGDDDKAQRIIDAVGDQAPLLPYPSAALADLIGGLSVCDALICSDGGAMHLAAGLGKPIVCLFGDSPAVRWRPWGVAYRLLQPASHSVLSLCSSDVLEAFEELRRVC